MANLAVDFDYLKGRVGTLIGYGDSSDWSADQEAKIEQIVNDGYRVWLGAPYEPGKIHKWSFLEPREQIQLTAPYTTGTIGIASNPSGSVVTLTGGTFPSWAAQGLLSVEGGTYIIASRDGNTQITLVDTSVSLTSGSAYSLIRETYNLPTDFGGFANGRIVNKTENLAGCKEIEIVSESQIRAEHDYSTYVSWPRMAAHFFKEVVDNNSTAYQQQVIEFYPPADRAYVLEYTYVVLSNELDDTNNTKPLGNQRYHDSLIHAVLAEAECQVLDQPGVWSDRFRSSLAQAVHYDKLTSQPRSYGKMTDPSDDNPVNWDAWERPTDPGSYYIYSS